MKTEEMEKQELWAHVQLWAKEERAKELQNAALLCAYVFGDAEGFYGLARGGYALLGGAALLRQWAIVEFRTRCIEYPKYFEELDALREEIRVSQGLAESPPVRMLMFADINAAIQLVANEYLNAGPLNTQDWLKQLCGPDSDLSMTDWNAVETMVCAIAIKKRK